MNEADNLRSVETDEKELLSENNIDEENIRINEVENESQEDEELEKEIEELKASSRKSFKTWIPDIPHYVIGYPLIIISDQDEPATA